jgi:hypothetical protein
MCCGDPLAIDGFDEDSKDFTLSNNRAKTASSIKALGPVSVLLARKLQMMTEAGTGV